MSLNPGEFQPSSVPARTRSWMRSRSTTLGSCSAPRRRAGPTGTSPRSTPCRATGATSGECAEANGKKFSIFTSLHKSVFSVSYTTFSYIGKQFSLQHVQQQQETLSKNWIKSRQIIAMVKQGRKIIKQKKEQFASTRPVGFATGKNI